MSALSIEGSPGVADESANQDGYDKSNVAVLALGSTADNPGEVNINVSSIAGSKGKHLENNDCRKKLKKNVVAKENKQEANDGERSSTTYDADVSNVYKASGLKHFFHGNIYQLKLLMLFFMRGLEKGHPFRLATEMKSAEKFNDLVFEYTNEKNKLVYRFLQAKHKQDNSKEITITDLLTETDGEFSLQKYFISFRRIKQNLDFKGELKDFIICTNIDLDGRLQKDSFEPIVDEDYLLDGNKQSKRLKYRGGNLLEKEKLIAVFKKTSDFNRLVEKFAEHVLSSHKGDGKLNLQVDIFKRYHKALAKHVIDIKTKKIKSDFISGNLCDETQKFRNALLKISKLSEDKFKDAMRKKKFIITDKFGKVLELQEDPKITPEDSREFVKKIVISGNKVPLKRTTRIVKRYIDELAGHMLVEENSVIKVRSGFLNSDIPGLEEFRKEFNKKIKDENKDVDLLEFEINNFLTCTASDYEEYKQDKSYFKYPLPNHEVTDEEINEFLDKLVLAVNQPNEIELGNIIKQKLGDEFNLMDSELIAGKILENMLNWMKQKGGSFLTNEDGNAFLDEAKQKLAKMKSSGVTSLYRKRIKEHGIAFNAIPIELLAFLTSSNENGIFNLANPFRTLLSSIKVDQALDSCQELYKRDDSHIFISLDDLLISKQFFVEAFASSTNLLIIECNPTPKTMDFQWLYEEFLSILKNNKGKKIILITEKDANYSKEDFLTKVDSSNIKYKRIEDNNINFNDTTPDSQTELVKNRNVIFQGQEISLCELITPNDLCENQTLETSSCGEILSKLINNEKIEIGKAPTGLGDVENFYIDRVFNRLIKINDNILQDSNFVDTESSKVRSNLQKDQDIIFISDLSGGDFEKICDEYEGHNVHWLKKEGNEFIWQQSHGSLSKLRQFLDTNKKSVEEYETEEINDKVVIVSAEPGMGKSTVLTKLAQEAKKADSSLWVLRVNLNDHTDILNKNKFKSFDNNVDKAVDFLLTILKFDGETFENKLFEYRLKSQGKINLFFDGFDEISPSYKETVIELLQILKGTKVEKLWITTRPYMRCELEDRFSILSYTLKPLSRSNQKTFLNRFWSKTLDSNTINKKRLSDYAEKLLDLFSKSVSEKEVEFASIPLQTGMLAEAFLNECKIFHDSDLGTSNLPKKLNILDLYERFIESKYDIYCKEKKKQDTANVAVSRDQRILKKCFIEEHQQLALYKLFEKNGIDKLFKKPNSILEDIYSLIETIKQGKEKTGIIDRVSDDKIPIFVHQTYAEYFAALWLADYANKKKVKDFIQEQIFVEENKVIRYFFDRMLSKDENKCKLHVAVLNDDLGRVKELLPDLQTSKGFINTTDKGGRTALHLAAAYGYSKIVSVLVDHDTDYDINDNICKWRAVSYAVKSSQWGSVELLLNAEGNGDDRDDIPWQQQTISNKPLIHIVAEKGYVNLAKCLINKFPDVIEAKDEDKATPLHRAARYGKFEVVKLLVEKGADVKAEDKYKNQPLHSAAGSGKLKIVKFLFETCKNYNDTDNSGSTPQCSAINGKKGKLTLLEFLVNKIKRVKGTDNNQNTPQYSAIEAKNIHGNTPLHLAIKNVKAKFNGQFKVVEFLVPRVNVNVVNHKNETPLHWATDNGELEIVKILVEKGATVDAKDEELQTPLHRAAAANKKCDVIDFLVKKGATVDAKDKHLQTPLHLAIDNGVLDIVELLVKNKASVHAKDNNSNTPLHLAAELGNFEVVKFLVQKFDNNVTKSDFVNAKNKKSQTPLHLAIYNEGLDIVEFLVENKANFHAEDKELQTPLHLAAELGNLEVVKFLFRKFDNNNDKDIKHVTKSDFVNAENKKLQTPLHLAAANGKSNVVKFLADNEANADAEEKNSKKTPLCRAAERGQLEAVQILVKCLHKKKSQTPLHLAASTGKLEVVEFLVKNKITDINAKNNNLTTPLHLAAAKGKIVVVKFLVENGANINAVNKNSKTPLQLATKHEKWKVETFLSTITQ